MKKVTKAVIPAAGLGTRVLPATKAMPKGMLPIVDKPAIQYLVEEAVRSGITDILIILGRNQSIIEDHFDRSPELEAKLAAPGKEKMLEECLGISDLANIFFVRQQQTLGLGHAVSMAKPFTGDDPFVVIMVTTSSGAKTRSALSSSVPTKSLAARLPVCLPCLGPT